MIAKTIIYDSCRSAVVSFHIWIPRGSGSEQTRSTQAVRVPSNIWGFPRDQSPVQHHLSSACCVEDSLQSFVLGQRLDPLLSHPRSIGPRTLRQYDSIWVANVPNGPSLWTPCSHTFWAGNVSPLQGQMPKTQFPANLVNKHLLITHRVQKAK